MHTTSFYFAIKIAFYTQSVAIRIVWIINAQAMSDLPKGNIKVKLIRLFCLVLVPIFIAVGCKKRPTGKMLTLFQAAREGSIKRIKSLISDGVDVNAMSENGMTPLHWAARFGHKEVVELLIAKGADVNAMSKYSGTPLCLAAQGGHKTVAEVLIAKGADVEGKDRHGQTAQRMGLAQPWHPDGGLRGGRPGIRPTHARRPRHAGHRWRLGRTQARSASAGRLGPVTCVGADTTAKRGGQFLLDSSEQRPVKGTVMSKCTAWSVAFCITLAAQTLCVAALHAAERPNFVWIISEDNSTHYLKLFNEHGAPAVPVGHSPHQRHRRRIADQVPRDGPRGAIQLADRDLEVEDDLGEDRDDDGLVGGAQEDARAEGEEGHERDQGAQTGEGPGHVRSAARW